MATIKAPNNEYNGVTYGVQFTNGIGQTDDAKKIEYFQEHGYTVDGSVAPVGTQDTEFANEPGAVTANNTGTATPTATPQATQPAPSPTANDTEFATEMGATQTNATAETNDAVSEKTNARTKR